MSAGGSTGSTRQRKIGKVTLRWQPAKDGGFTGAVIQGSERSELLHDDDEKRLERRLEILAGTLHPNYFGMDGAIKRFLTFMPGGFEGERNLQQERDYKVKASEALNAVVPLEKASEATEEDARAILASKIWINLLSPYETMRLKETLGGPNGGAFVRAAAKFAQGDRASGAAGLERAIKAHGALSWPIATYLPFLWQPNDQMFLKPAVTCDFAQRVAHRFQYDYESAVSPAVYDGLLDLVEFTRDAIAALAPRDLIDVQSFIYVVGGYRDADLPQ